MKRLITIFLAVLLLLQLAGCIGSNNENSRATTNDATEESRSPTEPSDGAEPSDGTEPDTFTPYTIKLAATVKIYDAPGGGFVQNVGEDGVYTIVEVQNDNSGMPWGKLKSGIGWIQLEKDTLEAKLEPLTVQYADSNDLNGDHHETVLSTSEYKVYALFQANEPLTDLCIYDTQFGDAGFLPDQLLYKLPSLTPEKPLIAHLEFPGDFSSYIVCYRDNSGTAHELLLSVSGMDGSLVLSNP